MSIKDNETTVDTHLGTITISTNDMTESVETVDLEQSNVEEQSPEDLRKNVLNFIKKSGGDISEFENDEQEKEKIDLNEMLNDLDFFVVLKSKTQDIQFIIPQLEDYDSLDDEIKENVAQNHFFLGFINFALNNEKWVEQYSENLLKQTQDNLNKTFEDIGDFTQILKNMQEINDNLENNIEDDKIINFREALEKLNFDKPKIIT
jgi:hypothetical protein